MSSTPFSLSSILQNIQEDPFSYVRLLIGLLVIIGIRIYVRYNLKQKVKNNRKITLKELYIYPIKSCCGISVQEAKVGLYGLQNDRKWMVYSTSNSRFVTQRQNPLLVLVKPSFEGNFLRLDYPKLKPVKIPLSGKDRKNEPIIENIGLWSNSVRGVDEGDEVAKWFQEILQRDDVRLVRMPDDHERVVPSQWKQSDLKSQLVSYADGFPFLLGAVESLKELNDRIVNKTADLPMRRFRPNFVVEGQELPFEEDVWKKIKIRDTVFRMVKKCTRCKVTTVDPDKGQYAGGEPLETLATFRKGFEEVGKDEVCFAHNLIQERSGGTVKVGDDIFVIE